jgi:hypothetical protein
MTMHADDNTVDGSDDENYSIERKEAKTQKYFHGRKLRIQVTVRMSCYRIVYPISFHG